MQICMRVLLQTDPSGSSSKFLQDLHVQVHVRTSLRLTKILTKTLTILQGSGTYMFLRLIPAPIMQRSGQESYKVQEKYYLSGKILIKSLIHARTLKDHWKDLY